MTTNYLHRELREKGGAYGGGCSYSPLSGVIQFTTYRDPIGYQRTLDKFRDSRKWALGISNHCGDRELLEAKMEVLKGIDRPLDAAEEGIAEFSSGLTNSQRQEFRIAIINATLKDVQSCALKHLKGKTVACVIGEQVKPE